MVGLRQVGADPSEFPNNCLSGYYGLESIVAE
jgi:hypothetical protein